MEFKIFFEFSVNFFKLIFLIIYSMIHCCNFILNLSSDILKNVIMKLKKNDGFKENSQELIVTSKCAKKNTKEKISNRNKKILEAWYKNNNRHPYASKNKIKKLALLTGLQENKIKRWLDNTRINSKIKPRKLFTVEETSILINFFEKETDHPGPAVLTFLANLVQKDSKKVQAWFSRHRFVKKNDEKMKQKN
jgi:hypothetical protein